MCFTEPLNIISLRCEERGPGKTCVRLGCQNYKIHNFSGGQCFNQRYGPFKRSTIFNGSLAFHSPMTGDDGRGGNSAKEKRNLDKVHLKVVAWLH